MKIRKNTMVGKFVKGPDIHPIRVRQGVITTTFFCGEGGIRTLDTVTGIPPFQGGQFNRSCTSPGVVSDSFLLVRKK